MLRTLILKTLLASACMGAAAAVPSTLVVTQRDGQTSRFAIADISKIWFTPTDVVVTTAGNESRFSRTAVKNINYGETTAVEKIESHTVSALRLDGTVLHFPDDCRSLQVTVFDSAGAQALATKTFAGEAALDIAPLGRGVYVALLSDGRTFKFVRK